MDVIYLSPWDLSIAALLVIALAVLTSRVGMGLSRSLLVAAARTVIQLLLIGLVLTTLFEHAALYWVALMALIMLLVAGREVMARQARRFRGWWGYGIGTLAMFTSAFTATILALTVIISPAPWWEPQYAIPLLGMLLGNTMTGIALGLDRLTTTAWQQRRTIEGRLILGQTWSESIQDIRRDAARSGLMPIINAMAAAGIVSLPGMMTGQILAGTPPMEAVKYQILVMFLITAGTGFGTLGAIWLGARRLFDERERLRLDRLA
ncbi:ABC transporter permease [Ectothiorhodospira haloalkaliphila]|uniref:ABC transporter permease n=1 Tax=Ectothiorhodospira haloalkaliphila TaxID=421628 RepID=W8KV53_9GAMM|nr:MULTISPECIES: iron export ABC transporter permease subunit FetB [Ectothiorhodospira]AHK79461.1 ABC transporter permease [Ectothiorhodospira haloalkaliphila]MCG5495101.1 iron export ABC transporter permease subunit FetB [Ectothiorhodospira variabilis]MCG5498224.1 iron export ABC transporter permease subunit FetB [Ectothiorhodospira variabilis]MCG5503795.1 iron export ABC transporter permease subunit FetB [Ectothiorhodospira variabilis]MCG5507074.1 iron export ABC transporter permease subunit